MISASLLLISCFAADKFANDVSGVTIGIILAVYPLVYISMYSQIKSLKDFDSFHTRKLMLAGLVIQSLGVLFFTAACYSQNKYQFCGACMLGYAFLAISEAIICVNTSYIAQNDKLRTDRHSEDKWASARTAGGSLGALVGVSLSGLLGLNDTFLFLTAVALVVGLGSLTFIPGVVLKNAGMPL
jgi:hypothetical protein